MERQKLFIPRAASAIAAFALIQFVGTPARAQIFTGSISGTVVDTSGGSVPQAALALKQTGTGLALQTESEANGRFVFPSVEPGEYTLTIEKTGFKTFEQKGIALQTGERLALGSLTLTVGEVTETVSVSAEAEVVKTESAERAGNINSTQVDSLLMVGRNTTTLVYLLPGVAEATTQSSVLDRSGGGFSSQGSRTDTNRVSVDGINSTDIDNGGDLKLQTSADAISEVTVLQNSYDAEYANASGAMVIQVSKSGTKDFHGGASYYLKNDIFDANNFFNNRSGIARPRDHLNNWNYSIGGPVVLWKLNRNRDKLFFFWNQEFWPTTLGSVVNYTVPTDLERMGDFSQSLDTSGALRIIRDPMTGSPFPQNRIPASRLDANGQKILSIFPEANFFDRTVSKGAYNYVATAPYHQPNSTRLLKIDYNPSSKDRIFVSWLGFHEESEGFSGTGGYFGGAWPFASIKFTAGNQGIATRWTRTVSATTVNELGFSWQGNPENADASTQQDYNKLLQSTYGLTLPKLFTQGNPLGFLPVTSFGGVPNAANLGAGGGYSWLPYVAPNNLYIWTDKLSMVRGKHWLKTGVDVQRFWRDIPGTSSRFGNYAFGVDALNPLDTNYAYSNAILGIYDQYQESNAFPRQRSRGGHYEAFIQDTWKITPRLTLDFGIRFQYLIPVYLADNAWAAFLPSAYNPSQAVTLFQPGKDANGNRVAVNPITGQTFSQAVIGAIVPGTGVIFGGMVSPALNSNIMRGSYNNRGIHYAPRFGLAWDVFGNHKTAVHVGGGLFYSPVPLAQYRVRVTQPPLILTPTLFFGQISGLQSATAFTFPTSVAGVDFTGKVPTSINLSAGIQHEIGFGTIVDVAYVGALGRHLLQTRNLNAIPFGADFLPANQDPTTGKPLPSNLLRPTPGYGDINMEENTGSSNYHSLQITLNKRAGKYVTIGAAYTYSKALDFGSADSSTLSNLIPIRIWNYGPADFDQTHTMKINWLWTLPRSPWNNEAAKVILNDWQVSGIASFVSGRPTNVTFTTVTPVDITGSPTDGARPTMSGAPNGGDTTFSHAFNTAAFNLPAVGTYGNASRNNLRLPGFDNWDVAIFKTIRFRERFALQLRGEMYNFFNHTQFSAFNTSALFNPATGQQVNAGFGQYTAARPSRHMQLGARFTF